MSCPSLLAVARLSAGCRAHLGTCHGLRRAVGDVGLVVVLVCSRGLVGHIDLLVREWAQRRDVCRLHACKQFGCWLLELRLLGGGDSELGHLSEVEVGVG